MSENRRIMLSRIMGFSLILMDIIAFVVSLYVAYLFIPVRSLWVYLFHHRSFVILLAVITFLNLYFFDLYYTLKNFRRFKVFVNLTLAIIVSLLFSSLIILIDSNIYMGRRFICTFFCTLFFLVLLNRMIFSVARRQTVPKRAVIVGMDRTSKALVDRIEQLERDGRNIGIKVVGYLSGGKEAQETHDIRCLGDISDAENIVKKEHISLMIFSLNKLPSDTVNENIVSLKLKGLDLISSVGLYSAISGQLPYEDISGGWLIEECLRSNKFAEIKVKRVVDLVLASLLLILSAPIILIVVVLIKLDSPGPAFFIQERIGRFGVPFNLIKLRSMATVGGPREMAPEGWHEKNASRITRLGFFLRRSHLDELPQLINIIKGDMSLVGPRPEMEMFIRQCEEKIPFYRLRLSVRPGLTGWAQVWYSHTSTLDGYRAKFKYDLFYLAHLTIKLDLEIIIRTVFRVLGHPRHKR